MDRTVVRLSSYSGEPQGNSKETPALGTGTGVTTDVSRANRRITYA